MLQAPVNLLIVTPFMPPAVGGGAIYTQALADNLVMCSEIGKIVIVTEKYPDFPENEVKYNGRLLIRRLFPFRCGVSRKSKDRYVKYLYQNAQFFGLFRIMQQHRITHFMVHNYFHNYPSLMGTVVRLVKKWYRPTLIVDVRDPRINRKHFKRLYIYDKVICCSDNVFGHFVNDGNLSEKLVNIPILLNSKSSSEAEIQQCKIKYGLQDTPYIFNASGVDEKKGADVALNMVEALRERGLNYLFVVAGRYRGWGPRYETAARQGLLRYIGAIPRTDVLRLSAGAGLYVNLSQLKIDSMPRASLEAMAQGARVLLPRGIPEFDRCCPEYVATSGELNQLVQQAAGILQRKDFTVEYDFERHSPSRVIPLYIDVLRGTA